MADQVGRLWAGEEIYGHARCYGLDSHWAVLAQYHDPCGCVCEGKHRRTRNRAPGANIPLKDWKPHCRCPWGQVLDGVVTQDIAQLRKLLVNQACDGLRGVLQPGFVGGIGH